MKLPLVFWVGLGAWALVLFWAWCICAINKKETPRE